VKNQETINAKPEKHREGKRIGSSWESTGSTVKKKGNPKENLDSQPRGDDAANKRKKKLYQPWETEQKKTGERRRGGAKLSALPIIMSKRQVCYCEIKHQI